MIREFCIEDLQGFEPNEYSDTGALVTMNVFEDDECFKFSFIDQGKVKAIIIFKELELDEYYGFFVISQTFRFKDSAVIKEFIEHCCQKLSPKKVWTASRDCAVINRWHKYLGMVVTGIKELEGKILNIWELKAWV